MVGRSSGSIRVLHVDDEPDFADMAGELISRHDDRLEFTTLTSAGEALARLEDQWYDCIVSDYDMPGQTGLELLQAVRNEHPDLPFILYTGKGSEEVASEAISAGVSEYLQKESGTSQYEVLANRILNLVEKEQVQSELRDREERLNLFFEQSPLGVIRWDDEFNFARLNETARDILGYDEGELVGQPWETVIPEEDREEIGEVVVADLLADEGGYHSVNENLRKDGMRIVCEWHNWVVTDDDDKVVAVFSQFQDITERKERERSLKNERDRRSALFDNSPNPVMELHFDEGIPLVVGINQAFEETFGIGGEEVYQRPVDEVIVPESEREEHLRFRDRVLAGERIKAEVQRKTTRGVRDFLLQVIPISPNGDSPGAYAWYVDITERNEREQELRERTQQLHGILNSIKVPVWMRDPDGRFVLINQEFRDLFGIDEETEVVGESLDDLLSPEVAEQFAANDRRAIKAGTTIAFEEDVPTPAGTKTYLTRITPLYDDTGELYGTCGAASDITDQKEREQRLDRQNNRLEEFASIVSHDLRNPLNVADGRLALAREECGSEHLAAVAEAHDRIETLIKDLLVLAQEGKAIADMEAVSLAGLVEECWRHVDTADASLVAETDAVIRADGNRLQQALENLIRNAVEHGGNDVTVTVGYLEDGFFVEDDGPGIPEDDRDTVFEAGYSTSNEGTGFGLNIVREIAEAHGWTLSLTGGADGGARFEFNGVDFDTG